MIISKVRKQWPENQETPSFGRGSKEVGKLDAFVDRLASDECFTSTKFGLGCSAIKEMVLTHIRERRRAKQNANICDTENAGDSTVSAEDSSGSSNGSPPSLFDQKRKEYASYFNPGEYCHGQFIILYQFPVTYPQTVLVIFL